MFFIVARSASELLRLRAIALALRVRAAERWQSVATGASPWVFTERQ
jgi:hypothetical protein